MNASDYYNLDFYDEQIRGSLKSAEVIVPLLIRYFSPASVADVGCGLAPWASVFLKNAVPEVDGYDGDYVERSRLLIPEQNFHPTDLSRRFSPGRSYDLALCLEVAEHLPPERAAGFVKDLTGLSDTVVFSAALPYQGGTGHVNENFPEYWAELFARQDYCVLDVLRERLWDNTAVCPWYRQNILVFVRRRTLVERYSLFSESPRTMLTQIHPEMYLWSCVRNRAEGAGAVFEEDKRWFFALYDAWIRQRPLPDKQKYFGPEFEIRYGSSSRWRQFRTWLSCWRRR